MFISNSIKTEVVTITPRLARKLLEQNTNNRDISPGNLAKIKLIMERGEWELNGEAIKIAKNGRILDGQHRLMAAIETATTFSTLIVYGLDDETQETMDSGKSRTIANVLTLRGYKNAARLASIVTSIIREEQWSLKAAATGSTAYVVTPKQVVDRLQVEPSLEELASNVRPLTALLSGRTAGLLYYVLSSIDADDAQYFFDRLVAGDGMERDNPILVLRNLLMVLKQEKRGVRSQTYVSALVVKAWNKYRLGEPVKQLKFTIGGANPESFPEPI
jgi:hypothetical protein